MLETETTQSHPLELEAHDDHSEYLLFSQTEIRFVLREVLNKGCMLTVYFDLGQSFFLTSLLEVNVNGIVLDYGSDEATNRRALRAPRLICTTSVDRIKVQFALSGLREIQFEGRAAFASSLPTELLRLQRREYFRVSTPIAKPLCCEMPVIAENGEQSTLQLPLLDISAGGLGLMANTCQVDFFDPGRVFEDCVLPLPDEAPIHLNMRVRNVFEVTNRVGSRYIRVGCEYLDVPGLPLNHIQRYITHLERERKARENGLE
ncbi:MAG: flagellar brake protein [Zoogloeaceae bacterium]|jgi:c-di-GMP-binding flagellar brake protein YcgR|nr:flagellar brake protein [Zoogloeaceae bacterium]